MKKRKLMARIIACVLAVILLLGIIVPVVSATEANDTLDPLPEGFEYQINNDGSATIIKSPNNTQIAFQLDGYYQGFDTDIVSIFIGNLETKKTTIVTLAKPYYLASVDLDEGYYVIYNGGYAWSDAGDTKYTIDEYQYFYVGDNFKYDKFVGVDFMQDMTKILPATVSPTTDASLNVIKYKDTPSITHDSIVFPTNAIPPSKNEVDNPTQPTTPEEKPGNNQQTPQQPGEQEQEEDKTSVFTVLFSMIKESLVLILLIAGCAIVLFLRKSKRENAIQRQSENDKYDDKRVE